MDPIFAATSVENTSNWEIFFVLFLVVLVVFLILLSVRLVMDPTCSKDGFSIFTKGTKNTGGCEIRKMKNGITSFEEVPTESDLPDLKSRKKEKQLLLFKE